MPRGKKAKQQRNIRRLQSRGRMSAIGPSKEEKQQLDQIVECMATKHEWDINKLPAWMNVGERSLLMQYFKQKYEEEKKK